MQTVITKFKYPDHLHAEAVNIGMHRAENNRKLDERKPEYKRPDEYNVRGALGELIVNEYLKTKGKNYIPNSFKGDKPLAEHDVLVDYRFKIDVKTIAKHTKVFSVNYDAHNNPKKHVTHYVFVKLLGNNECDIYACQKKYIDNCDLWEIETYTRKNGTTSTYYFKAI
jgi:hypothetical protein